MYTGVGHWWACMCVYVQGCVFVFAHACVDGCGVWFCSVYTAAHINCAYCFCVCICVNEMYIHTQVCESLCVCGSIHSNTSFHSVSILSFGTCLSMEVYDDWVCVCFLHKSITCVNPCECTRHACVFRVMCVCIRRCILM